MQASKLFDLGGKVTLVTGGSRGIGFQMAEALGEMGCKLAISARKQNELDAASAALRKANIEVLTIANDLGAAARPLRIVEGLIEVGKRETMRHQLVERQVLVADQKIEDLGQRLRPVHE